MADKAGRKNELKMAREGKTARMSVSGVIGWDYWGTSAKAFKEDFDKNAAGAATIEVEIDSPGGVITDGRVMINTLLDSSATIHTYVTGEAASMGSSLLMAGDKMFIPQNTTVMIHKPLTGAHGNAGDLRHAADRLDIFESALVSDYMRHFKGTEDELASMMAAETTLSAAQMEDKFNNVVVMRREIEAVACSEPVLEIPEATDDQAQTVEDDEVASLLEKFVAWASALKPKAESNTKEVDMPITPEEKTEIAELASTSVIEALKEAGIIEAKKEPNKPTPKPEAEVPEIAFEGDMTNPEDVQAHADKVAVAELVATADMTTTAGVMAYQEALAKFHKRGKGKEAPQGSNTSTAPSDTSLTPSASGASDEAIASEIAAVDNIRGIKQ